MIRRISDTQLLIVALSAIILISVISLSFAPGPAAPPLSVRSDAAPGAMALRRWIEASGYQVREVLSDPIEVGGLNALFVLDPMTPYTFEEAEYLRRWVSGGGRLIVVGQPLIANTLLSAYGLRMEYAPQRFTELAAATPLLDLPAQRPVNAGNTHVFTTERSDFLTHFARPDGPVLVSLNEGAGVMWASAMTRPFTNIGLSHPGSADLIRNILAGLPAGAVIGFDEAAHGFGAAEGSLFLWLFSTPPGWGIITAFALTLVYLLLRGRRFGRPVPLPEARLRREPVEYIVAMANLMRRSGLREDVLRHYDERLRRALASRYSVDASLPPAELAHTVAALDPTVNARDLARLLEQLSADSVSEEALVQLAREVDGWVR
jgi:hypothetical protein